MLLSEEQKKNFISRLQLTTVEGGEYIIMPSAAEPAFLVPISSKQTYVKALALIKPISGKGELKKKILSYIPPKWLKKKFSQLVFSAPNENGRHSIILPWSQKICDKLTYISFNEDMSDIIVHKYAFTDETREMVRNEHDFLKKIDTSKSVGIHIPDIKGFEDASNYTCLMQGFVDGMHMKRLSPGVASFFASLNSQRIFPLSEHPYIVNRMPFMTQFLKENGENQLLKSIKELYHKYNSERFRVATMHSDFSSSNTVQTAQNECIIIDWEDACEDGICIDTEYFKFRQALLKEGAWLIKNAEQFLAVFHYIHFIAQKKNTEMIKKFSLTSSEFRLKKI